MALKSFRNPIIPGFHPDPSCIRVEGTYYLVTSSFLCTPGIPIYTSPDLVHWTQIGNVITRASQLSLEACTIRPGTKNCGGIWAPTIRFHKGVFYVCSTCVFPDKDFGDHRRWENIVWKTTDPHAGAWSDGVRFAFPGYDTSLFWDDQDRVYVQGSTYWRVKEGIAQIELDLETGASLSGEPRAIWNGTGRRIPEAPHMYRKDGWYYLLIAEGGTELEHCATIARSKSVWGPFDACPTNPIIRAASPDAYFQTIGHAELVQSVDGEWFAVALATRDGRVNFPMGRETVLIPGRWDGDWPVFDARVESVMGSGAVPPPEPVHEDVLAGMQHRWPHNLLRLRNPDERAYRVENGALWLEPRAHTLSDALGSPTFIARRQTAVECTTELEILLPDSTSVLAGLSVYLDFEAHFDLVARRTESGQTAVQLRGTVASASDPPLIVDGGVVSMRVAARPDRFEFDVRRAGGWVRVGRGLARDVSAGFTGVVIGPYAEGGGGWVRVLKWVYADHVLDQVV